MSDEFDGWYRVGGKTLQFYATDDEIAEWLLEMLPAAYAPYGLLWQDWRDGRWEPSECAIAEVAQAFAENRSGIDPVGLRD